jgi:hypothetical protein
VLLHGGYAVGLGTVGGIDGPVFSTYRSEAGGPNVDAAVPYSGCKGRGLAQANGAYLAACRDNGLSLFAVTDPQGGRLLKSYPLASPWGSDSAAMAVDGAFAAIGGVPDSTQGYSGLYASDEGLNAAGTPQPPSYSTAASTPGTRPYALRLLAQEGAMWSFQRDVVTLNSAIVAYDFSNPWSAWPVMGSAALAGAGDMLAQPVSDGGYLYVSRSINSGASRVEVYDARAPSSFGSASLLGTRQVWTDRPISALAIARQRLYVGSSGTAALQVLDASSPALATLTPVPVDTSTTSAITGIAVSGRWLFYTFQAAAPGMWGLRVVRLSAANRDGTTAADPSGVAIIGDLSSSVPLANPIVSGDTLYVSSNLGVATFDLTPLWRSGAMPTRAGAVASSDPVNDFWPVQLWVDGPFGYLASSQGTYRVFDLR